MTGKLRLIDHALAAHKLTVMRDRECEPPRFRQVLRELSLMLCSEMTRDLDTTPKRVTTPDRWPADGCERKQTSLVIMPILRAGLVMADAFSELLPGARVGHIGIYRSNDGGHHCYMLSIPRTTAEKAKFLLLDAVVTGGGTAALAVDQLLRAGVPAEFIRYGSLIVTAPGLDFFYQEKERLGVEIFTFAIDRRDKNGFANPGLGNVGSRLFNTDEDMGAE